MTNKRFWMLSLFLAAAPCVEASHEPLPVGARAAGMAESFIVAADDALSLYYNPAGLNHVRRPEISTTYSRLFIGMDDKSEINRSFFGYAQPLPKKKGVLGASYLSMSLSSLYTETCIGLSYALEPRENLNIGASVKMLKNEFGTDKYTQNAINVDNGTARGGRDPLFDKGTSKSGLGFDLGAQYRLSKNYAMALALRNINQPDLAIDKVENKVPAVYSAGFGRWTRVSSISLEIMSWKFAGAQDNRLKLGGERWFRSGLGMRAGLGLGTREYRNAAVGGSYRMDGFQLDYALNYPLQGLEKTAGTHMVSLTFRFGKPAQDPIEARLGAEQEARLRAEAEVVRLRAQLMEMTNVSPAQPAETNTEAVDVAAKEALRQAEEEIQRLKAQKVPALSAPAPTPAAPPAPKRRAAAPVAAPAAPAAAKPRIQPDLLSQYSNELKAYANMVKDGASEQERLATLKKLSDQYANSGVDTSALSGEMKKIKEKSGKTSEEYQLSVNYYRRIVQQGTKAEDRVILLERILKKFKPMGIDTGELEKELESLKK
ncbi:MAG: conjugal transfer protein TraF [Elusimicrobia bacterium]|nr:conjugal transfer protein TraF [Elusimicrobiota bacterium]